MTVARWFREFGKPALKCARLGHRMAECSIRVFLYPPEGIFRMRHVADRAVEKFQRCRRCGHETEREITDRSGLNGLSMPSEKWDRLEAEGRVEA